MTREQIIEVIGRAVADADGYAYDPVPYNIHASAALTALEQAGCKVQMPDEFKPCAIENSELGATELILQDTFTVWKPWGPKEHAVDLGYDQDGKLIGMRVWDRVLSASPTNGKG